MSTPVLSIQLAAKLSGRHLRNDQKLKTGRFKSSPPNTFLLPPNATRGTPSTPESNRTEQGPIRARTGKQPAALHRPLQTGLADKAPAASSAASATAAAGIPQAALWQVRVAVPGPNCSLPAPGRPSGSGAAGAMSRVGGVLREQRGGGCVRLDERRRRGASSPARFWAL